MDMNELIEQLQAERHRIDAAIKLLSGSNTSVPIKTPRPTRKTKKMSAEGRRRISEAMKQRWADSKKKGA